MDIPAPYDGVVGKLFGAEGDILHVGEPLVGFEGEEADAGTVVGRLEGGGSALEDRFFIGAAPSTREHLAPRATPAVRVRRRTCAPVCGACAKTSRHARSRRRKCSARP